LRFGKALATNIVGLPKSGVIMKRIAILTMAALLLAGCAAETTDAADTTLPETTATESASPTAAPEAPTAETDAESAETTEADAEMEAMEEEMQAMEEEMQAGGSTASNTSPSPTATTSPTPTQTASPSPSPTASPTPTETPTETAEPGFTLAEVSTRNTASECWVAISGNVYDLTRWIAQHPGGSGAITQLCGTDGTRAFTSQHGGQSSPTSTLAGYLIGPLR
jgi:cytochrome b involved in lipid metabolism